MDYYDVFSQYLDKIFESSTTKDISLDDSGKIQTIFQQQYFSFLYNGSQTTQQYHFHIMEQAQKLLALFSILFAIVTCGICIMVTLVIILKVDYSQVIIPIIISGFTDLFTGILIVVMKNLFESRDEYFQESIKAEKFSKIIGLIQMMEKNESKEKMIDKIINEYCQHNHI